MAWDGVKNVESYSYTCGHCGEQVASARGYVNNDPRSGHPVQWIYLCHHCHKPTYRDKAGALVPGAPFGEAVEHLPDDVAELYDETRRCMSVNAWTLAVLGARKLLMNIAVSQGAKPGETFASYVDYLASEGYAPPNSEAWVDRIRRTGNEATHDVKAKTRQEAELLITFVSMLLKFIYAYPAMVAPEPVEDPA